MTFSIVQELSKTPEVFEAVLLHLTQRDLLHAQRVNRYWSDLIAQSPVLQRKLFFQPIPTSEASRRQPEFNPLVEALFPCLFDPRPFPDHHDFCRGCEIEEHIEHWTDDQQSRDAVLRPEASWRRMLPVQPAARIDAVSDSWWGCTGCSSLLWREVDASKYDQTPGTAGLTHKESPGLDLGTCATMGLLYDIVFHQLDDVGQHAFYVQWHMFPESIVPGGGRWRVRYKDEARKEWDWDATFGSRKDMPTRPEDMKLRNEITIHTICYNDTNKRTMDPVFSPTASINDIEHFKSIAWCATHLAAPNLIAKRPSNRRLGPGLADGLYGVTLNTPYTIPSMLLFYPDPDATSTESQSSIPEVKTLVTLGPLVSGFAGVCHGGIVMTLLDEVLSMLVQVNWKRGAIKGNTQLMTAYLNTTFSKPVAVPGTYLVIARLGKVEGRKAFGSVWIEDENGTMLTKAEGLFVMVRAKL